MDVERKIERQKNEYLRKIIIPYIFIMVLGYVLYLLLKKDFFIGWEIYFACICYFLILISFTFFIFPMIKSLIFNIIIENCKIKIKDGLFLRPIVIPIERLYYVDSIVKKNKISSTIFVIDKKINHKKIKSFDLLKNSEHKEIYHLFSTWYPDKKFYYYKTDNCDYKFQYFLYMIFRNCHNCKFSDASMELIKILFNHKYKVNNKLKEKKYK